MSRYYTTCLFTGTQSRSHWRHHIEYVYPKAPTGFLFHDTNNILKYDELRKPVHRLAELYEEAQSALLCRVNDQTIAVTFSTDFIPYPRKISGYYRDERDSLYPNEDMVVGLITNINNPAEAPVILKIGQVYEQCVELNRLAGNCPCLKLKENNRCLQTETIFPEGYNHDAWFMEVETHRLKTQSLKEINGFEFVSPGCTVDSDFTKGLRGWDEHDFSFVEDRKETFQERGAALKTKTAHRKKHCSQCIFNCVRTVSNDKTRIHDCGTMYNCKHGAVTEELAWQALDKYYAMSDFDNMPGFTVQQRDYLLRRSGDIFRQRGIISNAMKTKVAYGCFTYVGGGSKKWVYSIHAAAGDKTRCKTYESYTALQQDVSIPPHPTVEPLNQLQILACMIYGASKYLRMQSGWGSSSYPIILIDIREDCVIAEAAGTNRYARGSSYTDLAMSVKDWFRFAFGYSFSETIPFIMNQTSLGHSYDFIKE